MRSTTQLLSVVPILWLTTALAGGDPTGLALVLESNKTTYAPFEPVILKYWVANNSTSEIDVPQLIKPHYGWIKFEFAGGNGGFLPYRTGPQARAASSSTALQPGGRLSAEVIVVTNAYGRLGRTNLQFAGMKLFPFSESSKYRIRATYPLTRSDSGEGASVLASNTVEFSVRTATEDEAEAFAFFAGPEEYAAAVGADEEVKDLPAAVQRWEQFVERYPKSTYTPAVRLHLGELYLNGTGMAHADAGRASTHFLEAAKSDSVGLTDNALLALARSSIESGRFDEARAALARLLKDFPDSERKAEAVRLRDGLAAGWRSLRDIYSN